MKKEGFKQFYQDPPGSSSVLPEDLRRQDLLGSLRKLSTFETGELRSANYIPGVQGYRITPTSWELNTITFAPGSILLTYLQNIATGTVLGNASGSTGPVTALSASGGLDIRNNKINVSMARQFMLMGA